jgi:hypothetical protein
MKLKSLALAAACFAAAGLRRALLPPPRLRAGQGAVLPGPGRTAPALRAQRHALGQRQAGLHQAHQCPRWRHQRRQDHLRRVRNRLRHRQGRGVLRAPEGQDGGATVFQPLSTGITFALTDKAPGRQDPADHRRLRPQRQSPTAGGVQVELPLGGSATGWPPTCCCSTSARRKAGWTSSRARRLPGLSRQPLRQGADPAAAGALQDARLRAAAAAGGPHPGVEQKATWLQIRQQRPTMCCCGAGA